MRFISSVQPACFQNLLLGGPVIVVLETHSPFESAVCFHQQRMCLRGVGRGEGGGLFYTKGKRNVQNTFQCFASERVEPNDATHLREIRHQSFDGAPYRPAPSVSPWWRSSHTKLDDSKAEPYERSCPLGAPLNVLLGIACRKVCNTACSVTFGEQLVPSMLLCLVRFTVDVANSLQLTSF